MLNKRMKVAGKTAVLLTAFLFWQQPVIVAQEKVEKKEEGLKGWETSAAAGLTLTRGNSDTLLGNLNIQSSRKWPKEEVLLGTSFTYGETESVKTTEALQAYGQYNHLFTERLYGGVRLDFLHDDIADLQYRGTLSPMVGYYLVKNPNTRLSVEGGPSFIYEKQGDDTKGYIGARLAERLEHKFSEKARVWQSVEILPQIDDVENYLIIAEVGAEAALTEHFSLRVVLQDYYDNQPAPDRQKNDLKLIAALAYKF